MALTHTRTRLRYKSEARAYIRYALRKHPWPAIGRQERFYGPPTDSMVKLACWWARAKASTESSTN